MKRECITCAKEISQDQDYTTLICHAQGQMTSHTSFAHDKCWEKFKKSFVRGRGTANRTHNFFCPVPNCHNVLLNQHPAARQKVDKVERRAHAGGSSETVGEYATLPSLDGQQKGAPAFLERSSSTIAQRLSHRSSPRAFSRLASVAR
jgi:hypothetical protein